MRRIEDGGYRAAGGDCRELYREWDDNDPDM